MKFARIVKQTAIVIVDIAFRERPLGNDHVVIVKLQMEIFDLFDRLGLHHRYFINEILGLDQHAVQEHGVVRRNPKIASRGLISDRAGLDADRQNVSSTQHKPP